MNRSIETRLQKIETELASHKEPLTLVITDYSGNPPPPDQMVGGIRIRFVPYAGPTPDDDSSSLQGRI